MDIDLHSYANSRDEILLLTNHIQIKKTLDKMQLKYTH